VWAFMHVLPSHWYADPSNEIFGIQLIFLQVYNSVSVYVYELHCITSFFLIEYKNIDFIIWITNDLNFVPV
jgi:hypothetical protein